MAEDETQFYYLRLMSRSGSEGEPLTPKFLRWGDARRFSTSIEEEPELEVQLTPFIEFLTPSNL